MGAPASFAGVAAAWGNFYGAHPSVSVLVRWLHLSALMVGGGAAVAADRRILIAGRPARISALSLLAGSHRIVIAALVVVVASGGLMTVSDLETFVVSPAYWTKLALVSLLVLNGAALRRAESAALRRPEGADWATLRATSAVSLLLWLGLVYAGLWLTVAA
jgi:hypothetical protein